MRRRHLIAGLACAAALPARAAAPLRDVALGSIVALTGPASIYALGDAYSIRLAVREIEDDGGFDVAGTKCRFVLHEQDTGSKPAQTITATQKLLDEDGVRFIVGPTTTGDWVPAWGLLSKADVINISFATAVLPYLGTPAGKLLFFPNRGIQAPIDAAVDVADAKWHPRTAAMLIPGDAVGQAVGPLIKQALARKNIKLVYDSTFAPSSREFSAQLTPIKALQPDVLISGYFDDMMSTVMRQAVELGAARKFIGMRGVSEASGLPLGNRIDGLVFPLVTRDPSDPDLQSFDASFQSHFGRAADRQMANGIGLHDAVWMLAAAMTAAGTTTDVAQIATAMKAVTTYPHATLGLKYNAMGMAMHDQEVGVLDGATGKVSFARWTE